MDVHKRTVFVTDIGNEKYVTELYDMDNAASSWVVSGQDMPLQKMKFHRGIHSGEICCNEAKGNGAPHTYGGSVHTDAHIQD